jgi:peptidylprolyl isomerase
VSRLLGSRGRRRVLLMPLLLSLLGALLAALAGCTTGRQSEGPGDAHELPASLPQVTGDATGEPQVTLPHRSPPTTLVVRDLWRGGGTRVRPGEDVTVNYVGVAWSDGDVLDSSWGDRGPATFPLGRVIVGWRRGLAGMRVGGRRLLVVPPRDAYGSAGSGRVAPHETLVYVIDMLKAGH